MIFSAILPRRLFTTRLLHWFLADWLSAAISWGNGSQSSCVHYLSNAAASIASFKDYCFNPFVCCGTCVNPLYVNPSIYISYRKSVRPSLCLSVRHTLALCQNDSSYDHGVFTVG